MDTDDPIRRRITTTLAVVIISAFVPAFIMDMFNESYDIPPVVTSSMVLLSGWAFVDTTIRAIKKSASDEENMPSEP